MKLPVFLTIVPLLFCVLPLSVCNLVTPQGSWWEEYKPLSCHDLPEDSTNEFYNYPGYRDWWRYPLFYPYSIHTIDLPFQHPLLVDESQVTQISNPDNELIIINNSDYISRFNYNCQQIWGKLTDNTFFIYDVETKQLTPYLDQQSMEKNLSGTGAFFSYLISTEQYDCWLGSGNFNCGD
ncbi:MAG: hypothetical protein WCJ58_00750 [bacterium]